MPRIVSTSSLNDYPRLSITQYRASLQNASLDKIPLAYKYRGKEYRYEVAISKAVPKNLPKSTYC